MSLRRLRFFDRPYDHPHATDTRLMGTQQARITWVPAETFWHVSVVYRPEPV